MRVVLIGGVGSTLLTLEKLIEHDLAPVRVFGHEPKDSSTVSGHVPLGNACRRRDIPCTPFERINDHAAEIAALQVDVIFIVGLSQLVSEQIIAQARLGCIGFHPTLLPRGRGRAPIAWLVLEERFGAANLFLIDRGADSGPIFRQVPFPIEDGDDAQAVERKTLDALALALDEWLPLLKRGVWNPLPQNELLATEYGRRSPEDGWIDWQRDALSIERLVRASTRPHPGAYTFVNHRKLIAWKCAVEQDMPIRGVVGRILKISPAQALLVQTGAGLLWLTDYSVEEDIALRVGVRLGYYHELEIYEMRRELELIKGRLQ